MQRKMKLERTNSTTDCFVSHLLYLWKCCIAIVADRALNNNLT